MTDEASEPRTVAAPGVVSRGATTDEFTPRRALRDERWWFPSLVVVAFAVAVVLGLSGSSVAQLEPEAQRDDTLVGSSRPIRSDEWAVRTPFVVGQEERGLGVDAPVGVGDHNATVLYDLPTSDWSMLFRPHLWGYVVLPIDQAFAFDWWALSLVLLLGTYALVLVITRSWRWAALAAVALWASPFFHWWYLSITLATVGYAAAMIAAALVAIRSRDRRRRLVASAAAVWFGGCFAVLLYPPFQVPTIIVLGLWALGAEWGSPTWTHRVRRRAAIATLAAIGVGIGGVVAAFAATRADAISAIANTAYPGTRRIAGGDGSVNMLSSAWFGWNFLTEPEALRSRVFANESEASSFVMLGLFLLAGLPLAWRWLTRGAGVVRSVLAALSARSPRCSAADMRWRWRSTCAPQALLSHGVSRRSRSWSRSGLRWRSGGARSLPPRCSRPSASWCPSLPIRSNAGSIRSRRRRSFARSTRPIAPVPAVTVGGCRAAISSRRC